ncbi:MAG: beta-propeller domain-containing protein [Lachnospiraceae bacterium]|nr:beta-propeller domain-containing protein [Lachnospiraceae bacterium]
MKNMTEKELEEFLKQQADEIPVPDSLSPENMVKRIKKENEGINEGVSGKNEEKNKTEGEFNKKTGKFRKWMYRVSASAAVFLCGGIIAYGGIYGYGKWKEEQSGKGQTERESLCIEVLEEANQVSAELEARREWYEWAKEYGVDPDRVYRYNGWIDEDVVYSAEMAMPESATNDVSESAKEESAIKDDYSTTNVQVEGIDEADVIKTDGEYLYILDDDEIYIVDTKEELKVVGSISVEKEEDYFCDEMYVREEQLIIIETKGGYYGECIMFDEDGCKVEEDQKERTKVLTYNIENKEKPVLEKEVVQDGYYLNSRVKDDYLYLFTEYTTYRPENIQDYDAYVPRICGEELNYTDVCILPEGKSTDSLIVSAVDLKKKEVTDKIMLTSGSNVFYVSDENIYCVVTTYNNYKDYSQIVKIAYHEDELEYIGKTEVEGYISDQYYMDEKDGYLRLVAYICYYEYYYDDEAEWEDVEETAGEVEISRLYVLDENLNEVGRIDDVAPGESLYSCRFMGDMAYFVTFRQVDPLFAADLSDPYHPVLAGQLKLPGFSEYLQAYGDGLLLGIGYDADEETGRRKGVKLTMFDINDPANITEITSTYLPECSDVISDAKAILANANKNVIGITTYRYDGDMYYYCLSYENGEFKTNMQEQISHYQTRGIYIGDTLYVVNNMEVKAISLKDYSLKETLELE